MQVTDKMLETICGDIYNRCVIQVGKALDCIFRTFNTHQIRPNNQGDTNR